jgi:phospholipase C
VINPGYNLNFENGHIYDRLSAKGVTWRVYHHHTALNFDFPQVLSLKGMVDKRNDPTFFRPFSSFASDMSRGDVVGYTFIEPKYGLPSYSGGNSQHPTGSISLGETLIKAAYNAIFTQKVGANSALLITWDEHGGFFDHVNPPAAVPPGDAALNQNRAADPQNFAFNRFGVRVPAVLISPWLPAGIGSGVFGNNAIFDHASIVSALRSTFSLGPKLTNRDDASPDWNAVLLPQPRALQMGLPTVAKSKLKTPPAGQQEIAAAGPPSGNILGVAQIAADIDWHISERMGTPPLIVSNFEAGLKQAQQIQAQPSASVAVAERTEGHLTVLQYIAAVQAREAKFLAAQRRESSTVKPAQTKARPKTPPGKRGAKRARPKRTR